MRSKASSRGASGPADEGRPFYRRPLDEVLNAFGTDPNTGLAEAEARTRLDWYGANELTAERVRPAWRLLLAQFENLFVVLLLFATVISATLWWYERDSGLPYETIAILAVVILNAVVGFVQEKRAETAVSALRQMVASKAQVVRGGRRRSVPAVEVVPGDILIVEEGDAIPADARVIESASLQTSEAALTGESQPVSKSTERIDEAVGIADRGNMLFAGTVVVAGRGLAVVVATAMRTELGHIAELIKDIPRETTPLQRELDRTGRQLGLIVVIVAAVMILTLVVVERVRGLTALLDVLVLGVALAVAAVPEGLPAVVTMVLAIGVQRMARRNAIVRRLAAIEALGSADVIASDKTGTLTRNEMTVRSIVTASGRVMVSGTGYGLDGKVEREGGGPPEGGLSLEVQRTLLIACLANNASLQGSAGAREVQGDPTERALMVAALKAGLEAQATGERFRRVGEIPFSSKRKLMSTAHTDAAHPGHWLLFTKGAPDVLLKHCSQELVGDQIRELTDPRRAQILDLNEQLAGEALRTLGMAFRNVRGPTPTAVIQKDIERDLVFAGLVGMIDPPRDEAKAAVSRAVEAGIRPIMITGDHPKTAGIIARELGISKDGRVVTGLELEASSEAGALSRDASVFARVDPEHKLKIVKALQQEGAVVAMTGDGVNDAPALKAADIGVAMGVAGTDVSRMAADIVLADDNFATIVAAVEEGRTIYANIRKFLRYLLSSNVGEVLTMFLGVVLPAATGRRIDEGPIVLPLLATQLLWINLVTDGAPALALGLDPVEDGVMREPPRPKGLGAVPAAMAFRILFVGLIMALGTLFVLDASLPGGFVEGSGDLRHAQTMAFTTLVLFQMFNAVNSRSDEKSAFRNLFANGWLWAAIGFSILLQIAVIHVPLLQRSFSTVALDLGEWMYCAAVASSVLWLCELEKWIRAKWRRRHFRA